MSACKSVRIQQRFLHLRYRREICLRLVYTYRRRHTHPATAGRQPVTALTANASPTSPNRVAAKRSMSCEGSTTAAVSCGVLTSYLAAYCWLLLLLLERLVAQDAAAREERRELAPDEHAWDRPADQAPRDGRAQVAARGCGERAELHDRGGG